MMKIASAMSHISSNTEADVSKRIMLVVGLIYPGCPDRRVLCSVF